MQGQINPTGHLQGSINPTGNLQGTMSTESLIGGQVVGMRGLKGDKGDKGDTGEQGERGYGITSIVYNADKTITITYADGETVTTDVLQGEKGDTGDTGSTGATGNGIASAVLNADYTLTLTFTDGTTYTTPSIRGQKGDTGDTGQQGEQGVQGETGNGISSITKTATVGKVDTYTITFTDGTTTTFDVKNGEDGQGSGDMLKYDYDSNKDGKVNASDVADSVAWSGVTGKPEDYPPSSHTHDDRYYTESEVDTALSGKSDTNHTHDDRYYTEGEVDTALSNKVGLTDYATGSDAGVVKTSATYGVQTNASGYLYGLNIPSAQYGSTSINAVVSKGTLDNLISSGHIAQESDIPTKTSELTNDSGFLTQHQSLSAYRTSSAQDTIDAGKSDVGHTHTKSNITDFPTLSTVATSGSYNDLSNKPTIPTVNNATLTIQKNGSSVGTFTANASSNVTANVTVPTKTSELTNDSNFTTASGHNHDSRYYTETEIDNKGEFVKYLTGSGTAASSSGGVYYPAKWTFNAGITPASGKLISINIPVAGHDYGVYLSTNNGTNYYPVVTSGTSRLTTHYGASTKIMLIYDADGSASSMYPVAGGSSRVTVSGGVWRIVNYYDSNTYTSALCTTGASTQAKTASSSNFVLTAKRYLYITIANANTYNGAITLNVNSTGAKPIYINGKASSSSNKTLPAGSYLAYYDGTRYNFRTDGNDASTLYLSDCTITDSGSALSVTAGATTDDGKLAQAVIDAFDYATAKEILEV